MECPSCQTECLKAWKKCPECGVDLHKTTHETENATLRAENKRLADEKADLEAKLAEAKKSRLP